MISFPSTLNRGGNTQNTANTFTSTAGEVLAKSFTSAFNNSLSKSTTNKDLDTTDIYYDVNKNYSTIVSNRDFAKKSSEDKNIANNIPITFCNVNSTGYKLLDEEKFGAGVLNALDNYNTVFNDVHVDTGIEYPIDDKNINYDKLEFVIGKVSPSLFNPMYGLNNNGISRNVPLKYTEYTDSKSVEDTESLDCSISNLVKLSNTNSDLLGLARYKYSDFMYCRDVGKISNNHMITLRRFSIPVGDNIFKIAANRSGNWKKMNTSYPSDIGRMITWFGTPENKLEEIMSYEYESTFIEKEGKIQQLDSQEDDEGRGIIGKIINSANPLYNKAAGQGIAGDHNIYADILNLYKPFNITATTGTYRNNDVALGRNYDQNKVYEPKDTIRNTYIYEGKLIFKHEFALTFNYKLKLYRDINPKAAMLDLIGNILTTTYRKGKFWGGQSQIIGPQPNYDGWAKYNSFMNKIANQTGSYLDEIFNFKGAELDGFLGWMSNMWNELGGVVNGLKKGIEAVKSGVDAAKNVTAEDVSKGIGKMYNKLKQSGAGTFFMGMLKNQLGRPSLYAFDSILTGANVGLWHVTIGNPLNPIAVFGNLIMTNCKITHSGPLGLDDFPTDLTVTVSLKHAKGRDSVDISKMYTRGTQSIMLSLSNPRTTNSQNDKTIGKYVYDDYSDSFTPTNNDNYNPLFAFTGGSADYDLNAKELR